MARENFWDAFCKVPCIWSGSLKKHPQQRDEFILRLPDSHVSFECDSVQMLGHTKPGKKL